MIYIVSILHLPPTSLQLEAGAEGQPDKRGTVYPPSRAEAVTDTDSIKLVAMTI